MKIYFDKNIQYDNYRQLINAYDNLLIAYLKVFDEMGDSKDWFTYCESLNISDTSDSNFVKFYEKISHLTQGYLFEDISVVDKEFFIKSIKDNQFYKQDKIIKKLVDNCLNLRNDFEDFEDENNYDDEEDEDGNTEYDRREISDFKRQGYVKTHKEILKEIQNFNFEKKHETIKENEKESKLMTTTANRVKETAKKAAKEVAANTQTASFRTIANQVFKTAKTPMLAVADRYIEMIPNGLIREVVKASLNTPTGDAILKFGMGTAMPFINVNAAPDITKSLGEELRVQGIQHFTDMLGDTVLDPVRNAIETGLQRALPVPALLGNATMAQLPPKSELESFGSTTAKQAVKNK